MKLLISLFTLVFVAGLAACQSDNRQNAQYASVGNPPDTFQVNKTEQEWKSALSPEAYYVLREEGTERAFTGKYHNYKGKGTYVCAGCQNPLFTSTAKFDSGTGWPSFYQPLNKKSVIEKTDDSLGMTRVEIECQRCGGHLGHVFEDGPKPTGLRYCMNSVALDFVAAK